MNHVYTSHMFITFVIILCLQDRLTFRRIVLKNAYEKRKVYESLLENVPMLKTLEVKFYYCTNFYCFKDFHILAVILVILCIFLMQLAVVLILQICD